MFLKLIVSFTKVPINSSFRIIERRIITILDDCTRHSAEDRLDYVEELRTGWQWSGFDNNCTACGDSGIMLLDIFVQPFGNVPRRGVPG
ncbi:hypothetical protein OKW41_000412 [Paraburkholderia sp. UCT70]